MLAGGAVTIRLPIGLQIPAKGSTVTVACVPINGICTTDATLGIVQAGNAVRVLNLVAEGGAKAAVGTQYKIALKNIEN